MRHVHPLALAAALALTGCYPFITGSTYDEAVCGLDEDGDGNLKCEADGVPGDCNDDNASIYHTATEIPYDGLDNDCVGGDILDADGDGYAGISRADYEAAGGTWPSGMLEGDCDDADKDINPGFPETYYDGVDSNCDGACDYDQDLDNFADARQGADNDCGLPATDCLDSDSDIFPGAPGEVDYDGEDQDCDGANDFDPDGDGYAWDGYQADNTTFLSRYGYTNGLIAFTECYDAGDSGLPESAPLPPTDVSPDAIETFYNGVDDDCSDIDGSIENDFDSDGDGFLRTSDKATFLSYVQRYVDYTRHDGAHPLRATFQAAFGADAAAWEAWFDAHDNDCNDADATVFPGALEILGDSADQDCDGGNDTTPFVFGSTTFEGLGGHRLGATSTEFVLVASATEDVNFGAGSAGPQLAALSWDAASDATTPATQDNTPFPAGTDLLGPGVALSAFPTGYYTTAGWQRSGSTRLKGTRSVTTTVGTANYALDNTVDSDRISESIVYRETDLACDSSTCWALACDGVGIQYLQFNATSAMTKRVSSDGLADAEDCFVSLSSRTGNLLLNAVGADGTVTSYTVDGTTGFPNPTTSPFGSMSLRHASSHDEFLVLGNNPRGVTLYRTSTSSRMVLSSRATVHADAASNGTRDFVVAIEEGSGNKRVWLGYGNAGGSLTEVALPFQLDGTPIDANIAAVEVLGSRVMVAVSGTDASGNDQLGWLFFQI